ncbi:hypothetical protein BAE44_0011435 [Dichanthelium oligosanthes]|uniref:PGG domain-containing protein n=1 Tax=Dichanthelium oligosanthes TaxID=888268 RepID=A0A1E5VR33_9POAL|nr:hypothetical protein BAE44_0011435 [Dichanthelium oligosanthes]
MVFHLVTLLGLEAGHDMVAEVLRKTNERLETALHMSVSVGDKDMVKLLLWVDPRLAATVGLMYSGIAMVELPISRKHFLVSLFFVSSSVTCLTIAFALGVYMVLVPVAHGTAIAICAISPLLLIYRNAESLQKLVAVSGPLYARMGFSVWLWLAGGAILVRMLKKFWPFVVIFGLAGQLRNHHRQHG